MLHGFWQPASSCSTNAGLAGGTMQLVVSVVMTSFSSIIDQSQMGNGVAPLLVNARVEVCFVPHLSFCRTRCTCRNPPLSPLRERPSLHCCSTNFYVLSLPPPSPSFRLLPFAPSVLVKAGHVQCRSDKQETAARVSSATVCSSSDPVARCVLSDWVMTWPCWQLRGSNNSEKDHALATPFAICVHGKVMQGESYRCL